MPYLNDAGLAAMGFRSLGTNVRISDKASIHDAERISIGDNTRIDDFCVLSGTITLGRNVFVGVFCNLAGGHAGITVCDFATMSYATHLVAQSDDYSGATMTGQTIPVELKHETFGPVHIGRHAILGTSTIVLPGVTIPDGVAAGARTLFTNSVEEWSVYVGSPARRLKARSQELLVLEQRYLAGESS
jgi:galactoside O-acetyltransferase